MKYVTIFFDFEGKWGMPFEINYDLEKTTIKILKILKRYHVKATFNTCGKIIEVYPDIIKKIDIEGHEIAFHGYMHEDFNKISINKLNQLLEKTEKIFSSLTGKRLIGFRAPFLLAPRFYNKKIYQLFRKRGYVWCSNREIRFIEELYVHHRFKGPFHNLKRAVFKLLPFTKQNFLFSLLNVRLILMENINKILNHNLIFENLNLNFRVFRNFYWLNYSRLPILRLNILDFPVYSPLDCDLLGYPLPSEKSDKRIIDYAYNCIIRNFQSSKHFFNLNFHDWLIGAANRYELLERIIYYLVNQESVKIILPKELLKQLSNNDEKYLYRYSGKI